MKGNPITRKGDEKNPAYALSNDRSSSTVVKKGTYI